MIEGEKLQILAQLINAMNDASLKMEKAKNARNEEEYEKAKKEVLGFQEQVSEILKEAG